MDPAASNLFYNSELILIQKGFMRFGMCVSSSAWVIFPSAHLQNNSRNIPAATPASWNADELAQKKVKSGMWDTSIQFKKASMRCFNGIWMAW